ncbi:MAG: hypothetical protein ACJ746_29335 [Bryobacteraceae bacterium]
MVYRLASGSALLAIALALGSPTTGWQNKNFEDWTIQDAQSVMTNSPWSKKIPMPAGGRPAMTVIEPGNNGAPPPSASLGNPANTTTGVNMTAAANPGSAGPAEGAGKNLPTNTRPSGMAPSVGAPEQPQSLTVVWASATPVRLAILKLRSGSNPPTETQVTNARKTNEFYVVAVSGLPVPDFDPKSLSDKAFLTVKGRPEYKAAESSYRKIGTSDVYFFRFRRDGFPITAADKEVEFKVSAGSVEVKRKFSLRDMQYDGNLAL